MTDLTLSTPGVAGDERPAGPRRSVRVRHLIGAAAGGGDGGAGAVGLLACDRTEVIVVREPVAARTPIPASALSTTMVGVDAGVGRLYRRAPICLAWWRRRTWSRATCCRRRWSSGTGAAGGLA